MGGLPNLPSVVYKHSLRKVHNLLQFGPAPQKSLNPSSRKYRYICHETHAWFSKVNHKLKIWYEYWLRLIRPNWWFSLLSSVISKPQELICISWYILSHFHFSEHFLMPIWNHLYIPKCMTLIPILKSMIYIQSFIYHLISLDHRPLRASINRRLILLEIWLDIWVSGTAGELLRLT